MDTMITTPFGFASTADDVIAGISLAGKRAIVTGGASGIGKETARVLAGAGADVVLAVRNLAAGQQAAAELNTTAGHGRISAALLDVSDLASVKAFIDQWDGPLHMLINNAGVMALPELTRTAQGWEMQFATNFLGHHALCVGLHHALAMASRFPTAGQAVLRL